METSRAKAVNKALGHYLQEARIDRRTRWRTQEEFAEAAAEAGWVSAKTVNRILQGVTPIRVDYLYHLCEMLELDASAVVAEIEAAVTSPTVGKAVQDEVKPRRIRPDRRKDPKARQWFEKLDGTGESDRQDSPDQ